MVEKARRNGAVDIVCQNRECKAVLKP
jgi:hypothetical protein